MSANVGEGAKKLGEKLLAEVEVESLSSVLQSLRELQLPKRGNTAGFFNIAELDALFPTPAPPILELVSPPISHHPSGAGKTSLLYLIIAHAILPASLSSSVPIGGHGAAVVLFDPLHHFSVPRLAEIIFHLLISKVPTDTEYDFKGIIKRSLVHLHVFRPSTWPSLLATLRTLPDYLFDSSRHKSLHRRIHSIVLEDIDAFTWSIRGSATVANANPLATASTLLTSNVQRLTTQLSCAAILSSTSTSPSAFRPAIPTTWSQGMSVTRLAVRRVEVLRFAPALSVEEAEVERQQRWEVVQRGRFEAWKVGVGAKDREGFVFKVGKGVDVEKDET